MFTTLLSCILLKVMSVAAILEGYSNYSYVDSIGRPITYGECSLTRLMIKENEFNKQCGPNSNSKWPCFKHIGDDNLAFVSVEPWLEPLNMTESIFVKDQEANEFTLKDPTIAFQITYHHKGWITFLYYDYEPDTGCYKILLSGTEDFRLYVTTTRQDYRDIDTKHHFETGKRLCNKWIQIGTSSL